MRFGKVYVEITNVCNLNCAFCHGTKREKRFMSEEEFARVLEEVKGFTRHLYLHVMGEPLLHPLLPRFLSMIEEKGLSVNITTNGTLLERMSETLRGARALQRVNVSLHSFEGNGGERENLKEYVQKCIAFAKSCAGRPIVCFRLWNGAGDGDENSGVLALLKEAFPGEWEKIRKGYKIGDGVYLEYAGRFDWPDLSGEICEDAGDCFCYGLRDQCAVLCDGTVTPCCLDAEGEIALGNLFTEPMEKILSGERAMRLYEGFSRRKAVEELCRRCDYTQRFR